MAVRLSGLKGLSNHMALVAENLKMSLPLLTTVNICQDKNRERHKQKYWIDTELQINIYSIAIKSIFSNFLYLSHLIAPRFN